jgi:DNA-binding NarL/FixJ family response regulator
MLGERLTIDAHEAGDADAALALFARARPDAVLLEIHIPGAKGVEVLTRIKAADASILVVVLTNEPSDHHRRECMNRGADFFFDKAREFAHAVAAVIERAAALSPRS